MRDRTFSSEEFGQLIARVASDIVEAAIHYRLYRGLLEALRDYSRAMRENWTFWSLTIASHRDAAVFRLCRAYDHQRDAVSLPNWLAAIGTHSTLFEEPAFRERLQGNPFVDSLAASERKPDSDQLAKDITAVSLANPSVKSLAALRNNMFAHQSPSYALAPASIIDRFPLSADDVWRLIEQAEEILNRYSNNYHAQVYTTKMVGGEDYLTLLRVVEDRLVELDQGIRNDLT
jgi:hypothetical protein